LLSDAPERLMKSCIKGGENVGVDEARHHPDRYGG